MLFRLLERKYLHMFNHLTHIRLYFWQTHELKNKMKTSRIPWPGDEGEERWNQAWLAIKKVWFSKSWHDSALLFYFMLVLYREFGKLRVRYDDIMALVTGGNHWSCWYESLMPCYHVAWCAIFIPICWTELGMWWILALENFFPLSCRFGLQSGTKEHFSVVGKLIWTTTMFAWPC